MTKNILIFLVAFVVGITFIPSNRVAPQSDAVRVKDREIENVVSEFWSASLAGDDKRLDDVTSMTPPDFYVMFNRCMTPARMQQYWDEFGIESPYGDEMMRTLSASEISSNFNSVPNQSKLIRERGFSDFRVGGWRRSGTHALARVRYGTPKERFRDVYLYLSFDNGKWKVFKSDIPGLEDQFFAQKICDEPRIDIDYWEPDEEGRLRGM